MPLDTNNANDAPGYLSERYARSLAEFGEPRRLPQSGGWLLVRPIPGMDHLDAMGCYPVFSCMNWDHLSADLDALAPELVSVCLVPDPFAAPDADALRAIFPDVMTPFKEHFVVDLSVPKASMANKHHRYYARKARRECEVEACDTPSHFLDDWVTLYDALADRHHLSGIKAFSRDAFAAQLETPGLTVLRAVVGGTTVAAHLWYTHGDVATSHLAALSDRGYSLNASYALYDFAIEFFGDKVRWLNLGAGAGIDGANDDGLTRFKRGWATGTRTAYFCGRVLNPERYDALTAGLPDTAYFPAYRSGELA